MHPVTASSLNEGGRAGHCVNRRAFLKASSVTLASIALHSQARVTDSTRTLGRILEVGPGLALSTPSMAAKAARDGDEVRIREARYQGDVATWPQSFLRIIGLGRAPLLSAAGASSEGKAIWVMRGSNVEVSNMRFEDCRVEDHNGAGIRAEGRSLAVRNCVFRNNETAILTSNRQDAELLIECCELDANYTREGRWMHNIYVGAIARFVMRACHVHHGAVGHNLKCRARHSIIESSLIADYQAGRSSYAVEFPSGGNALVRNNIIHHGAHSENRNAVSFGAEDSRWPENRLVLIHNTLVDDRNNDGRFVYMNHREAACDAYNNLLIGIADPGPVTPGRRGNLHIERGSRGTYAKLDLALDPTPALSQLKREPLALVPSDLSSDCAFLAPLHEQCGIARRVVAGAVHVR